MGAYTLLQDLTVATNSTSVVLNDFGTITKDDFVKVVVTFKNSAGSNSDLRILGNSSVNANYHQQYLQGFASGTSAFRSNENVVTRTGAGLTGTSIHYLKLSENNRLNIFGNTLSRNDSVLQVLMYYTTSSGATFSSGITSLNFTTEVSNALGSGSRIQIYKLDAQKVADFVTTSNSTQVDIPFPTGTFSPAIDKDSEYLLVSELLSSGGDFMIFPNDLTTNTAYYSQFIQGSGSSTGANRVNLPRFGTGSSGTNGLTYAHIKLSNIGAFTVQSYEMHGYGTSSIQILNWFLSSTAENITSITKLNIKNTTTNAILAGSRFTLYKLYE